MRHHEGLLHLSATDIAHHLGCRHLTSLDRAAAEGRLERPRWEDPALEVLQRRGLLHEQAYLESLRGQGLSVIAPAEGEEVLDPARVREAMARGIDVIVQAPLRHDRWRGRADILRRVAAPSALGNWSYEVEDTKLAAETRGGTLLQICLYSELVGLLQERLPERMHVVTPGPGFPTQSYRVADFLAYYRLVRGRLLAAVEDDPGAGATYPEPVAQCAACDWWKDCDGRRHADDHLCLVAGMPRLHARELQRAGIATLARLGDSPRLGRMPRGSDETYERLRRQARLQLEARRCGEPRFERLPPQPGLGLALLPEPDAGDVFLDIDGDPFADEGGREYLIGCSWLEADGTIRYEGRWALDRAAEKRAFEATVDFLIERWRQHPGMHVYHFSPYDPGALKRLTGRHASREDDIDRLLRARRFVDLLAVVRHGVRAGVESYSIKDLEAFSGFDRAIELRQVSRARKAVCLALGFEAPEEITVAVRDVVEGYNRDDCLSVEALRGWLESVRGEAIAAGEAIERPAEASGDASERVEQRREEVQRIYDRLVAGLPEDPGERTPEQAAHWLLANLLDYFRREDKAGWWEFFRMQELSDQDLLDEREALAGLEFVGTIGGTAKCPIDEYRYPPQECAIREGDTLKEPGGGTIGEVDEIDDARRTVAIKKTGKARGYHPRAVFAHTHIPSKVMEESLLDLAEWVAAADVDAPGPHRAARDLLLRLPPRLRSAAAAPARPRSSEPKRSGPRSAEPPPSGPRRLCGEGEAVLDAARRLAVELDGGVLPVQGPPGSGKTYTGARMILDLLKAGRTVGVTAVSHKVIDNLLAAVQKAAAEAGAGARCVHKVTEASGAAPAGIAEVTKNEEALGAIGRGTVVGATAWVWSRPEAAGSLDTLVVDEAGQMSLAMVLAVARSARNLILLGDPQQLEQPQQGAHPEGTAAAALVHVLDGHKTMPQGKGLFLNETWRLAPAICGFTSELYYEGLLGPRPGVERQEILGDSPFAGSGLFLVPVEHEGNQSSSPEEVEAVAKLVEGLLSGGVRWRRPDGEVLPIGPDGILIVSPYNAQVYALQARVREVRVGTVDKFQGQEAPVVIYSMATSAPEEAPRGMSFLYDLNRFNVATSRARCACIVVASPRLFEPDCSGVEQMRQANALCRYRELARVVEL